MNSRQVCSMVLLLALFCSPLALADAALSKSEQFQVDSAQVEGACSGGKATYTRTWQWPPAPAYQIEAFHSTDGWSGACSGGRRDGPGVLAVRDERLDHAPGDGPKISYVATSQQEGSFVHGVKVGLWCTTRSEVRSGSPGDAQPPIGCFLPDVTEPFGRPSFQKEQDGRWTEVDWRGRPDEPASYVQAGRLEAESTRLIAEARQARPPSPARVEIQSPVLAGLIRNQTALAVLGSAPVRLSDKRVAVVMSSRMIAEIARFRAMRERLLAGSAKDRSAGAARQHVIAATDPAALVGSLVRVLRKYSRSVVAAKDLAVAQQGSVDYIILLDWSFEGDLAISAKQFQALAPCSVAPSTQRCTSTIFDENGSAWLLDRDLKRVRKYPLALMAYPLSKPDYWPESGNAAMLGAIADNFDNRWDFNRGLVPHWLDMALSADQSPR